MSEKPDFALPFSYLRAGASRQFGVETESSQNFLLHIHRLAV